MGRYDRLSSVHRILDSAREAHAMKSPRGLLALTATLLTIPDGSAIGRAPVTASPADARAQQKGDVRKEKVPSEPTTDGPAVIQGKTIDEWLAALKDRDPAMRKRAVEVVGERAVDPDVPADEKSRLQTAIYSLFSDKDRAGAAGRRVLLGSVPGLRFPRDGRNDSWRSTGAPSIRRGGRSAWSMPRAGRWQGAVASTFFSRDADREPSFTPPEPSRAATSNARGEVALRLEIPGHLDAAGVYAIRPDGDRPLVGVGKVTRERSWTSRSRS